MNNLSDIGVPDDKKLAHESALHEMEDSGSIKVEAEHNNMDTGVGLRIRPNQKHDRFSATGNLSYTVLPGDLSYEI